ncbi:Trk system potassium transporter TrkA [Mesohalobacter halotolerans]|uniref:Trk system potassium uptake protein TrkA n=1 Tax=Mesohalobacter halotolerans TaxID=1883405 RepID=A0A4U5TR45_9FLAO|nr:Trk system potassium transporter TrkA [Mesohalobacter halotolerans]MBS3739412.1 Trk system potassium transporter TrkA [Psychroflexus sp.]TKS56422.1 Trk system potassium transporter TrkA [Mesohalobacter halotolerans]
MKVIIAGAGEVGFHLAKLLSYESHNIVLIDVDKDRLAYADKNLDIKTIYGDATSLSLLNSANVSQTDLLISVTSSQSTNITICVISKQLGVKKTIARVSNPEFIDCKDKLNIKQLGIDEMISPEHLAAEEIMLLLSQSAFIDTYEFDDGVLTMIGLDLSENAPFVDLTVKEAADYYPGLHFMPVAIQRHGTQYTLIPRGDTKFYKKDRVYFVTDKSGVDELYKLSGTHKHQIKNVMILGGSNIGRSLAQKLCNQKFKVKLIEKDHEKALEIADMLPKTLVINANGHNVDVLEDEQISEMDAFISVTENSETNIMSCLVANSKNVRKTIALVENMDYFQLSQSIGINTLVNKKLIAANNIFRYIRKGDIVALTKLNNLNAELLEFEVKADCKICDTKIADIKIPRTSIIAGVIRDGEGIIALGDFTIKAGDRVLVCSLPMSIHKVEKLFV